MNRAFQAGLIAVISAWLAPVAAQAGSRGGTPEIFYQPAAGAMAAAGGTYFFTPPATFTATSNGATVATTETSMTGYRAQFDYSFTEAWAVHVAAANESHAMKLSDPYGSVNMKASGFRDYELWLSNLSALGSWTLYVALGLNASLEKRNDPAAGHEGNLFSGGTSIVNGLGLSTLIGTNDYLGLKFGSVTRVDRTANANTGSSSDYQIVGGNELTSRLFFEMELGWVSLDGEAGYDFFDPETKRYADGSQASNDAYRALVYGVGLQSQFLTNFNLRVAYEVESLTDRRESALLLPASTRSTASARLRFEF